MRDAELARAGVDPWSWPVRPIEVPTNDVTQLYLSGRCYLVGWSFLNTSTSAGTVTPYDGLDGNGTPLDQIQLPASGSVRGNYNNPGIFCEMGLTVKIAGVFASGVLFVRFEKPHEHVGGQHTDRWMNDRGEHGGPAAALRREYSSAYGPDQPGD